MIIVNAQKSNYAQKTYENLDWPGPGGNALIGKHKIKATLKYSLSPFLFRETKAT